jgi:hypothetical protein
VLATEGGIERRLRGTKPLRNALLPDLARLGRDAGLPEVFLSEHIGRLAAPRSRDDDAFLLEDNRAIRVLEEARSLLELDGRVGITWMRRGEAAVELEHVHLFCRGSRPRDQLSECNRAETGKEES